MVRLWDLYIIFFKMGIFTFGGGERFDKDMRTEFETWWRDALPSPAEMEHGANVIIRGVRNATDFDVEYQLAQINGGIHPGLESMMLPASPQYQHFSSSMAREMIRYGQPLEKYLPATIIPMVKALTEKVRG